MSDTRGIRAVIPVKRFAIAKHRLAPMLTADERACLARLMLEDVLTVLRNCTDILSSVAVVTSDPDAAALAAHRGATIVACGDESGINESIDLAVAAGGAPGLAGLMVVPSDIPHVTRAAIVAAADAIRAPRTLAIAEALNDGGTNLLACNPAQAVALQFGSRSFARHCQAAREAGIATTVLQHPGVSLDIDRPDDIRAFLTLRSQTRTHAFLDAIGAAARVDCAIERVPAEVPA